MEPDLALLDRYLVGDCTPDEAAIVRRWLDADPVAHQARLAEILDVRQVAASSFRWDVDAAWRAMAQQVTPASVTDTGDAEPTSVPHPSSSRPFGLRAERSAQWRRTTPSWRSPWRWTGIAVGFAAVGLSLVMVVTRRSTSDTATRGQSYATGPGQQATVLLRDGTRVRLAPQSHLRVAPGFGDANRDVTLDGEAYFDVTHVTHAPFVVRTGSVQTMVLGTAFDIATRARRGMVRIAVVSGKVMARGRSSVAVTAGGVAEVTDSSATIVSDETAAQYTTWTNGRLVFHDAPVADVLTALSQWYGIDFRMADSSLRQQDVTGAFDTHSQADALTALKVVLDASLTFDRDGDHLIVTIRPWNDNTTSRRSKVREPLTHSVTEVGR